MSQRATLLAATERFKGRAKDLQRAAACKTAVAGQQLTACHLPSSATYRTGKISTQCNSCPSESKRDDQALNSTLPHVLPHWDVLIVHTDEQMQKCCRT